MFAEPAFAVLLAVGGFALLNGPFIERARSAGSFTLFVFLFAVWSVLVMLAALLAWAAGCHDEDPDV